MHKPNQTYPLQQHVYRFPLFRQTSAWITFSFEFPRAPRISAGKVLRLKDVSSGFAKLSNVGTCENHFLHVLYC